MGSAGRVFSTLMSSRMLTDAAGIDCASLLVLERNFLAHPPPRDFVRRY
ncbi:hypothetical protein M673_14550 [Aureimonas sp. AU20]|nr:hypothetical protein M673_14550 [Aureimonas sp. AU20]